MSDVITIRPATLQDMDLLFEWRNDSETRGASHNTAEVGRADHAIWLKSILDDPNRRVLVAEEQGCAVGTVRADLLDGTWELSWTVAPKARGRGVAKRMVALFAGQISEPIRAEVKVGNKASIRTAECAGMTFSHKTGEVLHYSRKALK